VWPYVAVKEGEPLEEELAHARDAEVVGAPVLEAIRGELLEDVEALGGRDVPVTTLLDLREGLRTTPRVLAAPADEDEERTSGVVGSVRGGQRRAWLRCTWLRASRRRASSLLHSLAAGCAPMA
jgi:hypothetical protein